jgi:8-oxo-dGTP diphosphatase
MKTLFSTEDNAEWIQAKNRVEFYRDTQIPPNDLITSVHVLAFRHDQILFTKHPERGWDIPGGHIKKNETPKATLEREGYEETCVKLANLQVFRHIKITLFEKTFVSSNYPYPEGYIFLYIGHVDSLDPFVGKYEAHDRKFFPPAEAEKLSWVRRYRIIYDAAFNEIMKDKNK